jgi:hypothetical protein
VGEEFIASFILVLLVWEIRLSSRRVKEATCVLIVYEHFGTQLLKYLRWENFVSVIVLSDFHCIMCSTLQLNASNQTDRRT